MLIELTETIASMQQFKEHNITISVGGLTKSRFIDTPDIVLARADKALYNAKQNGKNQMQIDQ